MFTFLPQVRKKRNINHIAISLEDCNEQRYIERLKISEKELYEKKGIILQQILKTQVELDIPITTVFLLSSKKIGTAFSERIRHITNILSKLDIEFAEKNQVKISPIGKWYELPAQGVNMMKNLIDKTKDFDKFFLNLCIYYDGQGEILDACKMIARRIERQRLHPDEITKQTIEDNLYTSHYLAPEIVIINDSHKINGFLLWDISEAKIHFTEKPWYEFNCSDLKKIIGQTLSEGI